MVFSVKPPFGVDRLGLMRPPGGREVELSGTRWNQVELSGIKWN